ncbi:MAG TPA: nucleotidyltransferase family protein [Gammaproteobacteria bacterium]|nr:nucleotidyltransferase family protein [Gammaproteobacteria bacterium]
MLAGGRGTRLLPVVSDRPKTLAEIHGRPFLHYLLDQLSTAGCSRVVLCTGHLGEQIERGIGKRYRNLQISYSRETRPLGTGGALRLALPHLMSDPVLVMNGDSFCATDLRSFWDWHCGRGSQATMLLVEVPNTKRYGSVKINADGAVTEFVEKKHDGTGLINAGVYLLSRQVIDSIPDGTVSLEHDIFPALMSHPLYGYQERGRFLDIGTPEDFAAAEEFFAAINKSETAVCNTR